MASRRYALVACPCFIVVVESAVCVQKDGWCTSPALWYTPVNNFALQLYWYDQKDESAMDCWAGVGHEKCTCSNGQAIVTGLMFEQEGVTYHNYQCCENASSAEDNCGDVFEPWQFGGQLLLLCFSIAHSLLVCVSLCVRRRMVIVVSWIGFFARMCFALASFTFVLVWQSPTTEFICVCCLVTLRCTLQALGACWLWFRNRTSHGKLIYHYVTLLWLYDLLQVEAEMCSSFYDESLILVISNLISFSYIITVGYCCFLILSRLTVLQSGLNVELGRSMFKWLLFGILGLSVVFNGMYAVMGRDQIVIVLLCFILLCFAFWVGGISCALLHAAKLAISAGRDTQGVLDMKTSKVIRELRLQSLAIGINGSATLLILIKVWVFGSDAGGFLQEALFALESFANFGSAMLFAGALSGTMGGTARTQHLREEQRLGRRRQMTAAYDTSGKNPEWRDKVEELAYRAISLEKLFDFYQTLGRDVMPHFDPLVHSTKDVVQQAIIPLTARSRRSLAEDLMNQCATRPDKMITHNWSNLFRDLIAAVLADALDEESFAIVAFFLDTGQVDIIKKFLRDSGATERTYWICAFSINQHISTCKRAKCECGSSMISNDTPPLNLEGQSIPCEMNKFDDMMELLAAINFDFEHVIAVDRGFDLFDRAWCVAEIHAGNKMGLRQRVKPFAAESIESNRAKLKNLRVEDMRASRMEDVTLILSRIDDKPAFNMQMHDLIFNSLFADWGFLDSEQRLASAGKLLRWQSALASIGVRRVSEHDFVANSPCGLFSVSSNHSRELRIKKAISGSTLDAKEHRKIAGLQDAPTGSIASFAIGALNAPSAPKAQELLSQEVNGSAERQPIPLGRLRL